MKKAPALEPTLWRSCRILANRRRLQILQLLVQQPGLRVSEVAQHLELSLPVASQYLRALEARGFLSARRVADRVYYRPNTRDAFRPAQPLVTALHAALRRDSDAVERLFRLATAFTHPRRIEVFRILQQGYQTAGQLQVLTRISRFAIVRHLDKLEDRGFVTVRAGAYGATTPANGVARALARWAGG